MAEEGIISKDVFFLLTDQDLKDLGFNMGARRIILNSKENKELQPVENIQQQLMTDSQLTGPLNIMDVVLAPSKDVIETVHPGPAAAATVNKPPVSRLNVLLT